MTAGGAAGGGAAGARKLIHAALSLIAAATTLLLPPLSAAVVLAAATTVALAVELARRSSARVGRAFEWWLGGLLKDAERAGPTGATTLSLGFTLTAVLLPGAPLLAGILVAGLADPLAGIVGRAAGRPRFPGGKSPAGTGSFLVVAWGVMLFVGLPAGPALAAAAGVAALEAFTLPVDDNLYLPPAAAAAAALAAVLVGP